MCMKKFDAEKNILKKTYKVFNLAIFQQLHQVSNGLQCMLCEINSS